MTSDDLAARGLRVKLLPWRMLHPGRGISYPYGVWREDDGWRMLGTGKPAGYFPTLEAAKAAAQADYAARILAALETTDGQ